MQATLLLIPHMGQASTHCTVRHFIFTTWNTPATVANKGQDSTTSKGWAVSRISLRY